MAEIFFPYGKFPQANFESQFRRIFEAAECRTQVELANFLEIRQSSISDAKRRKAIPAEWLVKAFTKKRINPDWILTGQGRCFLYVLEAEQDMPPMRTATIEYRPPQECTTDELLIELARRVFGGFCK